MKDLLKLLRVKHYIKNVLILLPIFFGRKIFEPDHLLSALVGFVVFSLAASSIYIINDINDVENDKRHPVKCNRPLASGRIKISTGYVIYSVLICSMVVLNWCLAKGNLFVWGLLALYIISNLLYSKGLKNVVLLDVFILVLGYIIRLYYGGAIVGVPVSNWLFLTVTSMSFFMGFGKRRNEIIKQGAESRKVLQFYNKQFLDKNMYVFLGLTLMFYSLWCEQMTTTLSSNLLLLSVPIVIMICMRYSLLIETESDGDPVEVVFSDKILILMISIYSIFMGAILFLDKILEFFSV